MKSKFRKYFAAALAALMLLAALPVTALAEGGPATADAVTPPTESEAAPTSAIETEPVSATAAETVSATEPEATPATAETEATSAVETAPTSAIETEPASATIAETVPATEPEATPATAETEAASAVETAPTFATEAEPAPSGEAEVSPVPGPAAGPAEKDASETELSDFERVQSLIDALPDAASITDDNRSDVEAQLSAIDGAMLELTEDQAATLDTARYDAVAAALQTLDHPTGDNGMEVNVDPDPEPSTGPSALEQVQALIDALPDADTITADNRADVEAQLTAIDEAKLALEDEELDALDVTRYMAAVEAILALDGQAGDDVPTPLESSGKISGIDWTLDDSGILTLTVDGGPSELNLPRFAQDDDLWDKNSVKKVIIEGNITKIGEYAFSEYLYLEEILLPDSLTTIGRSAFEGCERLQLTKLPTGVTTIEKHAFEGCRMLQLTELPTGVTTIESHAFYKCERLQLTELPAGVTTITEYAFSGCRDLALTELPAGVTKIENSAFSDCHDLALTELPENLVTIGNHAFSGCDSLALESIPEGVTSIDDFAFLNCDSLTHLTLPESLESMGMYVFQGSDNLTALTFKGSQAPEIQWNTFVNAGGLKDIFIPNGATGYTAANNWPEEKIRYEITVNIPESDPITMNVSSADTVRSVKEQIEASKGIPIAVQVLTFSGNPLDDSKTLGDCGVTAGSTLELSLSYKPGGDGTANTPYLIFDKETMEAFRYYINEMDPNHGKDKFFKLTENINLSGEEWTPIGYSKNPFQGTFDGNNKTISGLYINNTANNSFVGLFGYISDGSTVKNLTVEGEVNDSAYISYVGGIVGVSDGGTIDNCRNAAAITTSRSSAGGIVGSSQNSTIKNCRNTGTIHGGGSTGGIVGTCQNGGTIENCRNTADITSSGVNAGGVVGVAGDITVINCSNTGAVSGTINIGGVAGQSGNNSGSGVIRNSYNTGAVTGTGETNVGGVVGSNGRNCTTENCYNTGAVNGKNGVGGVAGLNSGTVKNCYNTGAVEVTTEYGRSGGVVGSGACTDCYYLDGTAAAGTGAGSDSGTTKKTADQFASGEVAWLLQAGQDPQVWGQTVGSGTPELTGEAGKKVCKVTFQTESQEKYAVKYANYNGKVELPTEPTLDGTVFDHWSKVKGVSGGEKFDDNTTVTGDITVYAVGRETFGGDDEEIALTTTYGEELTEDLSEYLAYKSGTDATGKFEYTIISGNDLLNATIGGDNLSIPGTANAGDYTLTIKATEKVPQYSLMSVDTYGTVPVTLTLNINIKKADSKVETPPAAAEGLAYTGAEQELVTAGTATGGTMQYSLDGSTYSSSIPKGAEAKEYTVWYKVVGDENHNNTIPQSVTVTIEKAESSVTKAPVPSNGAYDGAAHPLVEAGAAQGGTMQYSLEQYGEYSDAIPNSQGAGEYTVWYKVVGDGNHKDSAPQSVSVTIDKGEGTGAVTMADYTCGDDSVDPVAESATNGTGNVTFTYSERGQNNYSAAKPTAAGEYTVKAVFAATDDYYAVTATADFKITHQFNAGWEHQPDGDHRQCACGTELLLETKKLTEVPEGLQKNPNVDTVEKIEHVLVEQVDTGDHYAIYDVELEAWIGGEWQIITPDSLPEEGVAVTIPYPDGTNARYPFTVVHMFTTGGDGHEPGDTEVLKATNEADGIHFTVKSFSPIIIGWKAGNLTVTVTDTGEGADPTQQWQFRVELDDETISGEYGDMRFTDGVAEFTLQSGQSLTARDLPEGVAYTVTELNGNQDGYTTSNVGGSGTIISGQDMAAAFTNDKSSEPEPSEPGPTEPKPTEPKPTEPKPTEPKPTEPKPTEPKPTEPKPTEPKPTEPKPTESEPTEPTPTEEPEKPTEAPGASPESSTPSTPGNASGTPAGDTPKTGDESHPTLWLLLMLVSLLGIGAVVLSPVVFSGRHTGTKIRHRKK